LENSDFQPYGPMCAHRAPTSAVPRRPQEFVKIPGNPRTVLWQPACTTARDVSFLNTPRTPDRPAAGEKRRQLLESVDNDEQLADDVIQLFAAVAPAQVAAIRSACAREDARAIGEAAHSMRGSAANFGTDPLLQSLAELEALAGAGDLRTCHQLMGLIETQTATLLSLLGVSEEPLRCAS
jgi:HPt (histidine-containing phosphotransfer) domain-containing protein